MASSNSPRSTSYSAYADLRDRITAAFQRGRDAHLQAQSAVPTPPAPAPQSDFVAQHARNAPGELKGADYKAVKPTGWENLAAGISGAATGAVEATPQLLALGADAWNLGTSPVSPGLAITNRIAQGQSVLPASEVSANAFTNLEKKGERAMGVREGALTDDVAGIARFGGNIVGDPLAVTGKIRSIATDEATRIAAFYEQKLAAAADDATKQQLMQMMRNDLARVAQQAPARAADVAAGAIKGTARATAAEPISHPPATGFTPEELAQIQAKGWANVPREGIASFVDQHIAPEAAGNQYASGRNELAAWDDLIRMMERPREPRPEIPEPPRADVNGDVIGSPAPVPPARATAGIPRDEGYVYHATNSDRLQEIADSGELRTHPPDYGTPDQNMWPDGSVEPRAYFSRNPDSTLSFAPEDGAPVVLRTRSGEHLATERGTGDIVARKPIKSSELEYLGSDQQWHNVDELKSEAAAPTPVAPAPKPPKIKPAKPAIPAPAEIPETGNWYYDNAQHAVAEWPALKGQPEQLVSHLKKQQGAVEDAVEIGLLKRDPSVLTDAERARLAEIEKMEPDIEKALATPREKGVKLPENIRQAIADRDKLNDKMIVPGDPIAGKKSISREEVLKYIDDNKIDVQEVVKGKLIPSETKRLDDLVAKKDAFDEGTGPALTAEEQAEYNALADREGGFGSITKYDNPDYQEPGGENYRELLLTKPRRIVKRPSEFRSRREMGQYLREKYNVREGEDYFDRITPEEQAELMALPGGMRADADQLPAQDWGGDFRASHWDEPNVLAHIRMNDRTLPDGRKMLFVEEFQSDWHQKGWERGYAKQSSRDAAMALDVANNNLSDFVRRYHEDKGTLLGSGLRTRSWDELEREVYNDTVKNDPAAFAKYRELKDAAKKAEEAYQAAQSGVPDAPFKGAGWKKLVLKRIMKYAADNGYDVVGWTTGAQQNARYSLSKVADSLHWSSQGNGVRNVGIILKDGGDIDLEVNEATGKVIKGRGRNAEQFANEPLKNVVGDEVAKKIMSSTPEQDLSGYKAKFWADGAYEIEDASGKKISTMYGFRSPEDALTQFKANAVEPKGSLKGDEIKDLEIGGAGKKHLYDEEFPSLANKIFGEHGVKTGKARIDTRGVARADAEREYVGPEYTPESLRRRIDQLRAQGTGDRTLVKLQHLYERMTPVDSPERKLSEVLTEYPDLGAEVAHLFGGEMKPLPFEGTEVHAIDVPASLRGTGKGKKGKLPLFNIALPAAGAGAAAAAYQNSSQRSSDVVPPPPKP